MDYYKDVFCLKVFLPVLPVAAFSTCPRSFATATVFPRRSLGAVKPGCCLAGVGSAAFTRLVDGGGTLGTVFRVPPSRWDATEIEGLGQHSSKPDSVSIAPSNLL